MRKLRNILSDQATQLSALGPSSAQAAIAYARRVSPD